MTKKILLLFTVCCLGLVSYAQDTQGPSSVSQAIYKGKTQPLSDFPIIQSQNFGVDELTIIPNGYEGSFENLVQGVATPASSIQDEQGTLVLNGIDQNFDGIDNTQSGFLPPDPTGAVGPNHYVQAVNSSISIFDKTGNLITGPIALGTFLGNPSNSGDPIVLYDQLADRWLVSEFGTGANSLLIGISETGDPTGAYNVYEILNGRFEDYPHYSVWPDGYYLTTNGSGGGGGFNAREVFVLERDAMLAGDPDAQVIGFDLLGQFANPTTIFGAGSANLTGTEFPADTPGFFIYLQDDAWNGSITEDQLLVWETDIDWDNINNSTISDPESIPVDPFDSLFAPFGVGEIDQPGTGQELAGQGGIISYMANYRTFADHNSWLITFNVDVDGNDTSGIRWIELRNNESDPSWNVFQQGTYAPNDGNSRFMSSGAMDAQGNIGLAFNIGGTNMPASIRYTGRFDGDTPGLMTIAENVIFDGPGVQTFSNRFGDYAHLTMDPDNFTFWHTTQYFLANDVWATRITSFELSSGFVNDVGVTGFVSPQDGDLTNAEAVEVVIRNFGTDPQSNIPLELRLDGNLIATEMFTGTIDPGETANYLFVATADLSVEGQTYVLDARTILAGDEESLNDEAEIEVTHLFGTDVGVTAITSPVSGGLGDTEDIIIEITNIGSETQTSIPVFYTLDGSTPVQETYSGSIAQGETDTYTFTVQGDFSVLGDHVIIAGTELSGDQDETNDDFTVTVTNMVCMPTSDCAGFGDGVTQISLADQDIITNCGTDPEGYSDDTDIVFNFVLDDNPFEGTLQVGFGGNEYAIWIDFNDNNAFESDELISNNVVATANQDFNFTIDFDNIPTTQIG